MTELYKYSLPRPLEKQVVVDENFFDVLMSLDIDEVPPVNPEDVFQDFRDSITRFSNQMQEFEAVVEELEEVVEEPSKLLTPVKRLTVEERQQITKWIELGGGILVGPMRETIRDLVRRLAEENKEMRAELVKLQVHYPG